ncbi:hypothetical protein [Kaistella jeonii]|uniref:Uncharacterized protein n=1 Tax=Kaistella jeonii TaxID=266749 RepID=A0A0C1CYF6_9FLAO|nr:hypothetical protein [Kaistella jeonii]KIA89426.1 hypothetical protein OA86_07535 [Kaistella jeonii]SFC05404.1 hypothetical protein SAMN05421876_105242 [Kaistella jeonii]VEI96768.1 Uncharacterised protein [Kaistella jeonii]
MIKLKFRYILLLLLTLSCSTEKINLSPVSDSMSKNSGKTFNYTLEQRKNLIFYSSEITNLIASFPKFGNEAVNKEVLNLKYHLKDYIGAMEESNLNNLANSQRKFEKSYKKLQHLRKFLKKQDDEVLNRYLVRIKINMSFLNSNISPKQQSAS